MSGPRKSAPQFRLVRGTAHKNKQRSRTGNVNNVSPLPAMGNVPAPPRWLTNADSLREWRRLAPLLVTFGLLHAGNVTAFGHCCALHGQLVQAWAAGRTPKAALLAAWRALANQLGLLDLPVAPANATGRFNRFTEPPPPIREVQRQ